MLVAEICQGYYPRAEETLDVWFRDKYDRYVAANVSWICGLVESENLVALCPLAPGSVAYLVGSLGLNELLHQKHRAFGMVLGWADRQVEHLQPLASAILGWP